MSRKESLEAIVQTVDYMRKLLDTHTEAELTAWGFDCGSHLDNPAIRRLLVGIDMSEPASAILLRDRGVEYPEAQPGSIEGEEVPVPEAALGADGLTRAPDASRGASSAGSLASGSLVEAPGLVFEQISGTPLPLDVTQPVVDGAI